MSHRRSRAGWWGLLLIGAGLPLPFAADAQVARTHRDEWQKVDEIFAALELEEGDWVADVGAGSGFFTLRMSPRVGSRGRVFAVDIDEAVLGELRGEVRRLSLDNVEVILGETDDPKLPDRSFDAALMVIAYHQMEEYEEMLAGIRRALRPGGRLVIVDHPARNPALPRSRQRQRHYIDISIVERDLESAGFRIVERLPGFVDVDDGRHRHRHWMLVAVSRSYHP